MSLFHPTPQHELDEMSIPTRICSQCHTGEMVKRFIGRERVLMREYITRDGDITTSQTIGKVLLHDCCVVDFLQERTSHSLQAISQ